MMILPSFRGAFSPVPVFVSLAFGELGLSPIARIFGAEPEPDGELGRDVCGEPFGDFRINDAADDSAVARFPHLTVSPILRPRLIRSRFTIFSLRPVSYRKSYVRFYA